MKTGKTAKDIFAPTMPAPLRSPAVATRSGTFEDTWTKVTVVLFNRQIVALDRLATEIRAKSGSVLKRAELIRALLDAVTESDLDLTSAMSESDVKTILKARMAR